MSEAGQFWELFCLGDDLPVGGFVWGERGLGGNYNCMTVYTIYARRDLQKKF